ncbi:unnamed protein product, partial [marine sediment metagenome]
QVISATRTPLERFEIQIKKLGLVFAKGLIDPDTFERAIRQAEEKLLRASEREMIPRMAGEARLIDPWVSIKGLQMGGVEDPQIQKQQEQIELTRKTNEILQSIEDKEGVM